MGALVGVGIQIVGKDGAGFVGKETIAFTKKSLQHTFDRHKADFGLSVNQSNRALTELSTRIQEHISAPGTIIIQGMYRGQPVTHYFNPANGLNVMKDSGGNLITGFQLKPGQVQHLLSTGRLGGGR